MWLSVNVPVNLSENGLRRRPAQLENLMFSVEVGYDKNCNCFSVRIKVPEKLTDSTFLNSVCMVFWPTQTSMQTELGRSEGLKPTK